MSIYEVDEYKVWNKAKDLFIVQRAEILSWHPKDTPPLNWTELGLEVRMMWYDRAVGMMSPPSERPTRPDLSLPKRVITLVGL